MTTTKTLADIAATSLSAVTTLERHGLDYCCGGKQPFDEACLAKGLQPADVMRVIQQARTFGEEDRDWASAPLGDLIKHILATHHEFLKRELPAISNRMDKVLAVHGAKDPEMLPQMAAIYQNLFAEMDAHMHKEEEILFPFIEQYGIAEAAGQPMPRVPFGTIANPITMMEREHEQAGGALEQIRSLTCDFELPSYDCSTVRALYEGIQAVAADLHVHIHLENNILFPRAIALEKR